MKIKFHSSFNNLKSSSFTLWVSILTTLVYNFAMLEYVSQNTNVWSTSGFGILLSTVAIVFIFSYTIFSSLALISLKVLKTFLVAIMIINACAIYFMSRYNVVLDRTMMGNIFNTRYSETMELLSLNLFLSIFTLGLLPACFLAFVNIKIVDRFNILRNAVIAIIVAFTFLYVNSTNWLWIDKHASVLGGKILPWSYIINSGRYYSTINRETEGQKSLPDGHFLDDRKTVFVLVIGETARAANFSLYGYPKLTNPSLTEQSNLLVLNDTKSCTTYTTGSLACILAPNEQYLGYEALPTYLARQGVDVLWRTNNWGEPPIVVTRYVDASELRADCEGDGCRLDEILLTNLIETIDSFDKQKIFVVLHTKGSHGPSYYTRYTKEFNQFTPVCRVEEISKCSHEELINAYDNTVLYTDHFLSTLISELETLENTSSAMLYISDHGESLGEHGLYLHGTPYTFAPDYQKNIPFLFWASNTFLESKHLNMAALTQAETHSQYNVFHTVLGALSFHSSVYESRLDILQSIDE